MITGLVTNWTTSGAERATKDIVSLITSKRRFWTLRHHYRSYQHSSRLHAHLGRYGTRDKKPNHSEAPRRISLRRNGAFFEHPIGLLALPWDASMQVSGMDIFEIEQSGGNMQTLP